MPFKSLIQNLLKNPERFFLFTPVLFAAGIGTYFSFAIEPSLLSVLFPVLFFALATVLSRKHFCVYLFFSATLIFSLGMACAKFETQRKLHQLDFFENNTVTYLKGTVKQTDFNTNLKPRLILKNAADFEKPLKGLYRLTSNEQTSHSVGTCVETAAVLSKPFPPLKKGTYQFDRHAFFENISATGYTLTPFYQIDCPTNTSLPNMASDFLSTIRQNINTQISKTLGPNEAAVAGALLTGDKSLVSKQLQTQFRTAGLAHFLAISGLHIGLVAAFIFLFVRFLLSAVPYFALKFSTYKAAAFCAILFAFIYLLLSGVSLSAERAFIMVSLVFLGIIFDRNAISMRTIAIAALIILIIEPHALLSAGFQMSFAAATALVAFYESYRTAPVFQSPSFLQKTGLYFFGAFLTSLVATLATLPYTLYHFATFSPYAVLSNVVSAPIIGFIIMPFVLIALLFYPFHLSFAPLKITGFGIALLNKLTAAVSNLPQIGTSLPPLPTSFLILCTIGGLWICLLRQKERFFGLLFIALGFISCLFAQTPDAFYTSDGKTIAVTSQNKKELIVFSKRKNDFKTEILTRGFQNVKNFSRLQSLQNADLICDKNTCTLKGLFTFDLNGNLFLRGKKINPKADLGGAVYLGTKTPHIETVRNFIGFRPWNTNLPNLAQKSASIP